MKHENTFYYYFEQNMSALGLPAPKSLFGTLSTTTATIGSMATYVKTWGTSATLIEWVATAKGGAIAAGGGVVGMATVLSEGVIIVGGLTASFYLGACLCSLMVATEKKITESLSYEDFFKIAHRYLIQTDRWLMDTLTKHPELLKAKDEKNFPPPILKPAHLPRLKPAH